MNDQPSIEGLKALYASNGTARALLNHCRQRARNQTETRVDRILQILRRDGHEPSRGEMIEVLRELEKLGCGTFVAGRKGWPSRFLWTAGMVGVSRAAAGEPPRIEVLGEETADEPTHAASDPAHLKEARIKIGLSQAELAEKIGVAQPTVSGWERGKWTPSPEQQEQLQKILGLTDAQETTDASPLAAWLTKARIAKGFSVPELAHNSGLTPAAIYRIEAGVTRSLRESTRKKLEGALNSLLPADTAQELADEAEIVGLGKFEDFDPHNDTELPSGPGIYVLYDISERPVYVGEGANVRDRIQAHDEKFWFKRPIVETASWIKVEDEKLRQQIERLLIKFLKSNAVINKQHVDRSE